MSTPAPFGAFPTATSSPDVPATPPSAAARPLLWLVRGYQGVRAGRPSPCRFVPSCSSYAVEALETHGAVRGLGLSIRRLLRCHPWGPTGYDPVPEKGTRRELL